VMAMLQNESKAHLLYHPTHCHADFLIDMPWQKMVRPSHTPPCLQLFVYYPEDKN
jgi:hypothetical protein